MRACDSPAKAASRFFQSVFPHMDIFVQEQVPSHLLFAHWAHFRCAIAFHKHNRIFCIHISCQSLLSSFFCLHYSAFGTTSILRSQDNISSGICSCRCDVRSDRYMSERLPHFRIPYDHALLLCHNDPDALQTETLRIKFCSYNLFKLLYTVARNGPSEVSLSSKYICSADAQKKSQLYSRFVVHILSYHLQI